RRNLGVALSCAPARAAPGWPAPAGRMTEVIVVGSGISGAAVAKTLVDEGVKTELIDIGFDDSQLREAVPDAPFTEVRQTDRDQARYFIGDRLEGVPAKGVRVGAQLTPPRQFLHRDAEKWLPSQWS